MAKVAPTSLVAPPRTVSDVTAILDQQKPDPARTEQLRAAADAAVPDNLKGLQLADFYYKRGAGEGAARPQRRSARGCGTRGQQRQGRRLPRQSSAATNSSSMRRLRDAGQHKRANEISASKWRHSPPRARAGCSASTTASSTAAIRNGDINAAEAYAARNRTLLAEAKRWPNFPIYGANWQANVEDGNARVAEARGLYADAEANYRKAVAVLHGTLKYLAQWESKPPEGEMERAADWALALEGRVKVKQGRVGEGEADVRRALLSRLSKSGKYPRRYRRRAQCSRLCRAGTGPLSGGRAAAAPGDRYLSGPRLSRGIRPHGQRPVVPRANPQSAAALRRGRASSTTRSTSGPRSGNRRGAKRSAADWRGFRPC